MDQQQARRDGARSDDRVLDQIEELVNVPRRPTHCRPEAATRRAMVNLVSGRLEQTEWHRRDDSGAGGSTDLRPHLELVAWVHDVGDPKDVWVDLYLYDPAGELISSELHQLSYQGRGGGNGGLFALSSPVPGGAAPEGALDLGGIQYRLYYRVNDAVYTDGILHAHRSLAAPPEPEAPGTRSDPGKGPGRRRSQLEVRLDPAGTCHLVGELDMAVVDRLVAILTHHAEGGADLRLDCSRLGFLDYSGVCGLAGLAARLGERGQSVVLMAPGRGVLRALHRAAHVRQVAELRIEGASPGAGLNAEPHAAAAQVSA